MSTIEDKRMNVITMFYDFNGDAGSAITETMNIPFKVKKLVVKTIYTASAGEIATPNTIVARSSRLSTDVRRILSCFSFTAEQSQVETTFIYDTPIDVRGEYRLDFATVADPSTLVNIEGQLVVFYNFYNYI